MFSGFGGYGTPGGNLASDYGPFWEVGGGILYQSKKKWLIGLDFSYLFGTDVKKDPVPNLRTSDGNVIGRNGSYAYFEAFQRGFMFPMFKIGKTFSIGKNPNFNKLGGFTITTGAAWFQHWTYINDISKQTPQFASQYKDGYDRLTGGPGFGGWFGYLYLPERGKINFHFEAGYFTAFTQTKRFDFVTAQPPGQKRQDGIFQVRLRICFTIRSRTEDTYYIY